MNSTSNIYIPRLLSCPERSFFLFGPRGTGKSAWLRHVLTNALLGILVDEHIITVVL